MGRHEEAVERAIEVARRDGYVTEADEAAVTLLLAGAKSMDVAEDTGKPYLAAQTIPPMLAVLQDLRMTPASRDTKEGDALDELIANLADPEA